MNWQIRKFELKKVLTSPIVWVLLLTFILFNGVIIFSNFYLRSDLNVLTTMVQQYGHEINEETLTKWEQKHERLLVEANDAVGQTFDSAQAFFNDSDTWMLEESDRRKYVEIMIMEQYLMVAQEADDIYSEINMVEKGEEQIDKYDLNGKAAKLIRHQYQVAQDRLEELKVAGEHRHFFFDGYEYKMHSLLFGSVLKALTFELTLLAVLLTGFLLSYEFDSKTYLLMYTTKCGRRLQFEKLKTALLTTAFLSLVLIGLTLVTYFIVYDYSGLWNVPISTIFMSEFEHFLISAYPMSFIQYLLAVIGVILGIQFLFVLLTFVIGSIFKNSYLVFVLFAIVFGVLVLLPELSLRSGQLFIYSAFTPVYLLLNLDLSFMIAGIANSFQYYEILTLAIWVGGLTVLSRLGYRIFKASDL